MNELRNNQHMTLGMCVCLHVCVIVCFPGVCMSGREGRWHKGTIPSPWGNILYLFQSGRCRRINGCLHKRVNTQGFHSKVYNIKDVHNSHILSFSGAGYLLHSFSEFNMFMMT